MDPLLFLLPICPQAEVSAGRGPLLAGGFKAAQTYCKKQTNKPFFWLVAPGCNHSLPVTHTQADTPAPDQHTPSLSVRLEGIPEAQPFPVLC